jgi:pilus assembly protein Flp/PilA
VLPPLLRSRDESGQGLVEYALILLLIAIALIVAVTFLGTSLLASLNDSAQQIHP